MARHKNQEAGGGVNLGLIITPMLDMSFQILSFFIMTYNPSALEGHIPGSLVPPETVATKGKETQAAETIPQSIPEDQLLPELAEAITVKVKAAAPGQGGGDRLDGQPAQILIKRTTDTQPKVVADVTASLEQGLKQLEAELKTIQKEAGAEKANIKLEGDGELKQQYVMQVYDVCKRAGFTKVHFVPPPIDRVAAKR
jgi:biopolymer transport protein ExbD